LAFNFYYTIPLQKGWCIRKPEGGRG